LQASRANACAASSLAVARPAAGAGLALLRRAQLEAVLAPGAAPDAAEVVPALPLDLELRLAGWLRGARVAAILRSHRYSRRVIARVEHLLRLHPLEAGAHAAQAASVRRRCCARGRARSMRSSRCATPSSRTARPHAAATPGGARATSRARAGARARSAFGALALHRFDLAIRGDEVMRLIGGGPGPTWAARALPHRVRDRRSRLQHAGRAARAPRGLAGRRQLRRRPRPAGPESAPFAPARAAARASDITALVAPLIHGTASEAAARGNEEALFHDASLPSEAAPLRRRTSALVFGFWEAPRSSATINASGFTVGQTSATFSNATVTATGGSFSKITSVGSFPSARGRHQHRLRRSPRRTSTTSSSRSTSAAAAPS
jgi:hypothetical protein